jgi:hypothetical protein
MGDFRNTPQGKSRMAEYGCLWGSMLQQMKNAFAVKIIADPAGSNVFRVSRALVAGEFGSRTPKRNLRAINGV